MTCTPRALLIGVAVAAALAFTSPAPAQQRPHKASVSIYRVAPGKHLEFLQWMAARDAADHDVGVPAAQWYAHLDGDSWDYVAISPDMDDATSDKVQAAARKRGLTTGPKAGLEFRQMISSHSDTAVAGPMTATQLLDYVSQP